MINDSISPKRLLIPTLPRWLTHSALPEALIVLLAALVRGWRLTYHSFWFDEIVSLGWAAQDPATIWAKTFALVEEKHPPAYYLTLHFWQQFLSLFGLEHNEAALRVLGAILGVLTVWGILLLARHLSGRAVGLLTGLLVALSPALVWYSQELRMFQPAITGIVWGAYWLVRMTGRGDEGRRTKDEDSITQHAIHPSPILHPHHPLRPLQLSVRRLRPAGAGAGVNRALLARRTAALAAFSHGLCRLWCAHGAVAAAGAQRLADQQC